MPNSGFTVGGSFVSGDSSDMLMDYNNGRIIVPAASGERLSITGYNTVKEVNVYLSEDSEEKLLVQGDFIDSRELGSSHLFDQEDKRDDKTYILPAVFIKYEKDQNVPASLGGEVDNQISIRVVVLGFDHFIVDGTLSFFKDRSQSCMKLIPFEDYPYGRSFTLNSYPYDYTTLAANYTESAFIGEVRTSKVTDSLTVEKLQKNLIMGFIDFNLSIWRYPNL